MNATVQVVFSADEAARHLGVDPDTWAAWEHGTTVPKERYRRAVEEFIRDQLKTR